MRNIRLTVEYDGTNYHGWQSQAGSGSATIQATIEEALRELTAETVRLHSSGRTDAGVHALGHVANFLTQSAIPAPAWAPALNHILPSDIRIVSSDEVPLAFHSRYSARGKIYKYLILARTAPSALFGRYAWHIDRRLVVSRMKRAAAALVGRHDFSAFRSSACAARTTARTLRSLTILKRGDFIEIRLEADAFLMHMARNIVGSLVEAGLGRVTEQDMKKILRSRDRTRAGRTAPARGLYLERVLYGE